MGNFKIGDNIVYNFKILAVLYSNFQKGTDEERLLLCKPIILINTSIIEAILFDFHRKAKGFTREKIVNLTDDVIEFFGSEKKDLLDKYIRNAKDKNLFQICGEDFYEGLDILRHLRNRIHIQSWYVNAVVCKVNGFDCGMGIDVFDFDVFVCFFLLGTSQDDHDPASKIISVDKSGRIMIWPYSRSNYSGFGWFIPSAKYKLRKSAGCRVRTNSLGTWLIYEPAIVNIRARHILT